jgi:hypothetical protein
MRIPIPAIVVPLVVLLLYLFVPDVKERVFPSSSFWRAMVFGRLRDGNLEPNPYEY